MKLTNPVYISARLLPAVKVGDATVQLEYDANVANNERTQYRYTIDLNGETYTDTDLNAAYGANLTRGFSDLFTFLEYWATPEEYEDDDSADMFPAGLRAWATTYRDEFSTLAFDFEENDYITE